MAIRIDSRRATRPIKPRIFHKRGRSQVCTQSRFSHPRGAYCHILHTQEIVMRAYRRPRLALPVVNIVSIAATPPVPGRDRTQKESRRVTDSRTSYRSLHGLARQHEQHKIALLPLSWTQRKIALSARHGLPGVEITALRLTDSILRWLTSRHKGAAKMSSPTGLHGTTTKNERFLGTIHYS